MTEMTFDEGLARKDKYLNILMTKQELQYMFVKCKKLFYYIKLCSNCY